MLKPEACPICKSHKEVVFLKDYKCENQEYFLFECRNCFAQFWLPMKNPGGQWYELRNPHVMIGFENYKIYRGYHKKFLKRNKKISGLKILDLGCGAGEFIFELQRRGAHVFGVDFDKSAINIAKEKFQLKNVFSNSFENFFEKKDLPKFDIITFFEVLEHQDNPVDFLEKIKKMLSPTGRIALSAPSRERFLKNTSRWDFPPHHFTRWNRAALEIMFLNLGFERTYFSQVEEIKILMNSIGAKLRTGLVRKTLLKQKNSRQNIILAKTFYFLGKTKQWVLALFPAFLLFLLGKILGVENGIIYAEIKKL